MTLLMIPELADDDPSTDIWVNRLESYNRDIKLVIPLALSLLAIIPKFAELLKKGVVEALLGDAGRDVTKSQKKKQKLRKYHLQMIQ